MGSSRSTRRRRQRPLSLPALAGVVDEATRHDEGHVLVHLDGPAHRDLAVGLLPIGAATHPFEVVAGSRAPAAWTVFGMRVTGRAHRLDHPHRHPARSATTFLVDRQGREASVLRSHEGTQDLPGPALGTIPDLCRRVLGLSTAPPPPSTRLLWTLVWLDRILDAWAQPLRRRDLTTSWGQVAVRHPAIHAPTASDVLAFADPASLVTVARSHAAAASWRDVRRSPLPVALPDGPLPRHIAEWMDDGFFARWTIGAYPPANETGIELRHLLGDPLGRQLLETTVALLD
jgi:hypothetical protein